jgi:hypothetical protein
MAAIIFVVRLRVIRLQITHRAVSRPHHMQVLVSALTLHRYMKMDLFGSGTDALDTHINDTGAVQVKTK